MAYRREGAVGLHAKIKVRRTMEMDGKNGYPAWSIPRWDALSSTTRSRRISALWTAPIRRNALKFEIDFLVGKKQLGKDHRQMHQGTRHAEDRGGAGRYQGAGL